MGFVLNQFNQPSVTAGDVNNDYMTIITEGTAKRKSNSTDNGVYSTVDLSPFYDECITFDDLSAEKNYYFHAKIKRMDSDQVFLIYLINYEEDDLANTEESKTQYIKTITVQKGLETEWVDLELMFTPLIDKYNCLVFQLIRNIQDYQGDVRYPVFVYEELSLITNIIPTKIGDDIRLTKIGVQSHPGLVMNINGEEIQIGRSGIYELGQSVITIDFFSVVQGAEEVFSSGTMTDYLATVAKQPVIKVTDSDSIKTTSVCLFGNKKTRNIDSFTLDYLYQESTT